MAKKARKSGSEHYIMRNFIVWSITTTIGLAYVLSGNYNRPVFDRGFTNEMYTWTASAFGVAVVYSFIAYTIAKSDEKKQFTELTLR